MGGSLAKVPMHVKQQAVIKILTNETVSPKEIHGQLLEITGDESANISTVCATGWKNQRTVDTKKPKRK